MQGQRTRGPHAKGGPAHTDETCRGVLQQGQEDWKSWVAGPH